MTITKIFSKLQHRLVFAAFERWRNLMLAVQQEARREAAFKRSQTQALAFFEKLASEATTGTIVDAFHRWKQTTEESVRAEQHHAATVIQVRFRQRRAKALLHGLKKASLDKEFKRKAEIQQLLKFESYGTAMQWSTLRNGFNLLLQNVCARRIQFFFRRFVVRCRILRRIVRNHAAIRIQSLWRRKVAQKELLRRKERFRVRQELEARAATEIQRHVRGFLATVEVAKRRAWQSNENQRVLEIQRCWGKYRQRLELHRRFAVRKRILDAEKAEVAQLQREEDERRLELLRHAAASDVQRVFRGFQGRNAYKAKLFERTLELAVRRVQTSWRRSKGRYALQLRFSAQRDRLEVRRQDAALRIQCACRMHRATQLKAGLKADLLRRQHAATAIQRVFRGKRERKQYQRTRRATIAIQGGIKSKLARLERQRRFDRRLEETRRRQNAALRMQTWIRGVLGRMVAKRMREMRAREELLAENAALLIQKRARGIEARKTAQLLRQAMQLVELEQKRHFQESTRHSSPLLDFMTQHYLHRPSSGDIVHFTSEQCVWLQDRIQDAREQIAREDKAVVFLQRYYRGHVARVDYVVKKTLAIKRRKLERKMATVLQRYARGFLARRRVKHLRQKRKLEDIKQAYIRERRWKAEELAWKEQYQREQMELQLRKAKVMEWEMKEAKRDAELAKWRAEAAAYKKQELQTQQELAKQRKTESGKGGVETEQDELEDGWTEMRDAYGNVYFYNETTLESSWDRPTKKEVAAPEETLPDNADAANMENTDEEERSPAAGASGNPDDATSSALAHENASKSADPDDRSQEDVDVVPEGSCWKCRTAVATKECMDCSEPHRRLYCAPCYLLEHHTLSDSGSKQRHDFKVLVAVKKQSQCLSLACKSKESGPNLATYYCDECSAIPPIVKALESSSDTIPATTNASKGCFFCEECFSAAHETAQELHHVPSALHFRTGALLCCECGVLVGTRLCEQCDEAFCGGCFERIHSHSQKKRDHVWTPIEILKEELASEKDAHCIDCDLRKCTRLCNLCGDGFCEQCFPKAHEKGKKQQHTWISWERFSQVGDWLEIFDEKANATIFFNIESKESTTKQPFVLKSGAERHQLQFQEREQLQKRKELELASEIIKLKEQLKEMQEKELLGHRPLSRNLRSAVAPGTADGNAASQESDESSRIASEKRATKKKKGGLFGSLFARCGGKQISDDGLTPEERKRHQLMKSIRSEEQDLVMARMKTREREEKEVKAKETVGTKQFEDAILQELSKST